MATPSSRFGRQGATASGNEVNKIFSVPMGLKSLVDRCICPCVLPALSWEEGGNKVWRGGPREARVGRVVHLCMSLHGALGRNRFDFLPKATSRCYYYRGPFDACLALWKVDRVATARARGHIPKSQPSRGGTGWLPLEIAIKLWEVKSHMIDRPRPGSFVLLSLGSFPAP